MIPCNKLPKNFIRKYKIRKLLTIVLISSLAFTFFGCAAKEDRLCPNSQKVIVQEKKVVVSCKIPKIECEFTGENFEPTKKLIECLKKQKEAIKLCNQTQEDTEVTDGQ